MTEYPRRSFKELAGREVERAIRKVTGLREPPMPEQAKRIAFLESEMDCLGRPRFEEYDKTHRIMIARNRCEARTPDIFFPQYYVRKADAWHFYHAEPYVLAFGTRAAAIDNFREALDGR